MMSIRQGLGHAALLSIGCLLAGCAMQRSESAAPSPAASAAPGMPASTNDSAGSLDRSEPATLAEAEAWLAKAQSDFDQLALNVPPPASGGAAAPAEAAQAPAPAPAAPRRAEKSADKKAEAPAATAAPEAEKESPNACETACKAFSSLSRASDAVCRLDSEGGQRCQRARQIQGDASRRVASCGCAK